MTLGRLLATAAVCALLLLAGCSEESEPKFAPPTPTPTPSASQATTPEPEAWEEKTERGAVAFAEHWVDVFNSAQRNGDVAHLEALSGAGCGTCDGVIRQLENLYSEGGVLKSDGWRVLSSVLAQDVPLKEARVAMRIQRSAQVIHYGNDRKVERFDASRVTLSAQLVWVSGAWVMDDLVALQ